jgi:hypothetical protein
LLVAAAAAFCSALPAVVFDGSDLVGVDETRPYTARPMDYYTGGACRYCASSIACLNLRHFFVLQVWVRHLPEAASFFSKSIWHVTLLTPAELHSAPASAPPAAAAAPAETKVKGEQLVLAANSPSLAVVALRPSGIFGEGDTVMVPTFVRQAKAGKMKYIIGNGKNVWDFTYVGNVAQAHVLVGDGFELRSAS